MATDNTDNSVIWAPGDSAGHHPGGATAAIPVSKYVVPTGSALSTAVPSENLVQFVNTDLYWFNGTSWLGPYSTST